MLEKLRPFYQSGRLSAQDWKMVRHRFRGHYRDMWVAMAFQAYGRQDWRLAVRYGLRGILHYPRAIVNRGFWAMLAKSAVRWRKIASS